MLADRHETVFTAMHSPAPILQPDNGPASHLHLRTGNRGSARFHSGLHHLYLVAEDGQEERVDLGFAGSRLLARLLQHPGEVVSRETLIAHAWPERVVGQGSLNQQVYTLRQILGDEKNREIIQTLPRRGYLFNPAHVVAHEPAVEPQQAADAPVPAAEAIQAPAQPAATAPARRQNLLWATFGAALITTFVALGLHLYASPAPDDHGRLQLGALDVLLLEPDAEERRRITQVLQPTLERLGRYAQGRQRLAASHSSGYYALHCIHGTRSYTLSSHQQQLAQISDASLQRCLQ